MTMQIGPILSDGEINACLSRSGWITRSTEASREFAILAREMEKLVILKVSGIDKNVSVGNTTPNGV